MYYKLINNDMCNRSHKFKIGLNILNEPFNPSHGCLSGGFYFCTLNDLGYWLFLYPNGLIFEVIVPENAFCVQQYRKFKADLIYIDNPLSISDFIKKHNVAKLYFNLDSRNLQHINVITDEKILLIAVKQNCQSLANIPPHAQTHCICLAAIACNGNVLEHIHEQTPDICLAAVTQNGNALAHVKIQTPEICLAAVRNNGFSLSYVNDQTPEICLAAVKQNCYAISCIKNFSLNLTKEMCIIASEKSPCIKDYILEILKSNNCEITFV